MKTGQLRGRDSLIGILSRILLLAVLVSGTGTLGMAQKNSANAQLLSARRSLAEQLTSQLLTLHGEFRAASPAQKAQLAAQLQSIAATRQKLLASLVENDPGTVLRLAIPSGIRSSVPPAVQAFLEQYVQLQGRLEVIYEDSKAGAKLHHALEVGGQRFSLHFASNRPTNLLTGATVRVRGVQVQQALALTSGTSSGSVQVVAAAPLPKTFGDQSTLVILVNFQDNTTQPYAPSTAYGVTFGSGSSVTNFDLENSFGQTWLTGNVVGWYTLPITSTCNINTIGSYANQAASAAGVNLSSYQRFVYGFPSVGCGWWGMSYVGGNQSWIEGSYQLVPVAHEMGHQYGLYHSHSLNCLPNIDTGTCSTVEYGDPFDTMGDSPWLLPGPHFNPFQKQNLGWLNYGSSPPIVTVQSNGTYTIGPYEAQDGTAKALKIFRSTDPTSGLTTWYYVEYRQASGFDSFLSGYPNVTGGVLIRLGTDSSPNTSDLVDVAPALNSWTSPALDAGLTFTDPVTGTSIQTVSTSSTGATVSVTFGSSTATCTHSNPSVSMSPSQSALVSPGTMVSYTVSVTNNDNSACSSSTFNLGDSAPSGWSAALGNTSITLAPGAKGSTGLQVTSPSGTASGTYPVGASATNSSVSTDSNSASATYDIASSSTTSTSLTVAVTTNQSTYSAGQMVSITVKVTSGGAAVSGDSVAVNVIKPGGSVVSQNVTTGTNGVASSSYKLKHRDPTGTYQVQAIAGAVGTAPSAQATTSFTVQ